MGINRLRGTRWYLQSQSPTKNCSWLDHSLKLMLGAHVYLPPPTLWSTGSLHSAQNMLIVITIKHKSIFLKLFSIFTSFFFQEYKPLAEEFIKANAHAYFMHIGEAGANANLMRILGRKKMLCLLA